MNVTINTDASFHPEHKVGAFAFWLVCNQGRILHNGPLKHTTCSLDAELQAIGNALHCLLKSKIVGVKRIYLNCDSIPAIHQLLGKSKRPKPAAFEVRQLLDQVAAKYKLTGKKYLYVAHVKAHNGTDTPRKFVNDWCDKMAKHHMHQLLLKKWMEK